ncbi:MAG: hypothetical protein JW717_04280 [Marinilabiliaceae bacterium]|nr:hypothetical protein [Marinilabiliaceae bacterium]MBN2819099.1 hypothetical protein [Bacteroidales bacterium]
MQKPDSQTINEATQRAKQRLSIDTLQKTTKYKDITEEGYNNLFKYAEAMSLLILEAFTKEEILDEKL